jgi:drug/metabolite transporter (DMT)-like permease
MLLAALPVRSLVAGTWCRMGHAVSASAVAYALAAAICFALASALQHQAATNEQDYRSSIHLLWQLAHRPRWAAGLTVGAAGLALHAAALHSGALAVVQPLLVMGLAFALPLRALLDRTRPSAAEALAAAVLAGGVAVFVVAAHPSGGQPAADAGPAVAVIAAGAVLAGACSMVAARGRSGRLAGFALGLAAGILYGLVGGVLKAAVHTAIHHPAAAATAWPVWTLVVLGAWAFVVHQRAYALAPLSVSLPALSVANPLVAIVFGAVVFGERPASGPLAMLTQALGLVVIVVSVTMLARPDPGAGSGRGRPADGGSDRRDPAAGRDGRIQVRRIVRH